jgi:hypothetical protein
MATTDQILTDYQDNIKSQERRIGQLKDRLNTISLSRLGAFILEILIVALMINLGFSWVFVVLIVIPFAAFAVLVRKQSLTQEALSYEQQLLWVYQNEADHLLSNKNGYDDGSRYADDAHPYSSDLDIFGPSSLYVLLNRCNTLNGMDLLAASLQQADGIAAIRLRQEAIRELTVHINETFHFRALLKSHKPDQLQVIIAKLKKQLPEQLKFTHSKVLRLIVRVVPFVSILMFVAAIAFGGLLWKFLLLFGLFNSGITLFFFRRINLLYAGFGGSSASLNDFSAAVKWTEKIQWQSSHIRGFFDREAVGADVSLQIKKLASIIQSFDARLNILLGALLNLFLLWDLKHAIKLSDWHQQSSAPLIRGLHRINQFEELISLATLHHNQPSWIFPVLEPDFHLQAKTLGHPLIPIEKRVSNDFVLGQNPTTDIVTGSNMAGKSTFLRTVGINMVLAFAGAPVCAEVFNLSVFDLLSYMRIKDSLNDQTSTFKAELNRLKMILDATENQKHPFVLIDEMLRGTNSKDKYLGSRVFIEKLISQQTPALFATHDLQLSEMEPLHPQQIRNYHFDIQIEQGEMQFDYKLKLGPCKTFNAALLLREIGLTLS